MGEQVRWYVPVSYAAELLGCPWTEVNRLIEGGALEFIRTPKNQIKVSMDSINQHLYWTPMEKV